VVALVAATDFTSLLLNQSHFIALMQYAFKLLTIILLSYPMFNLVSPFRLMRALQQSMNKLKLMKQDDIKLYSVMIMFKFIVILQKLWLKLIQLYRVKYKRLFIQAPGTFIVHFIRESLFIAESVIINYEVRQPLKLTSMLYKVKLTRNDGILTCLMVICCTLTIIF